MKPSARLVLAITALVFAFSLVALPGLSAAVSSSFDVPFPCGTCMVSGPARAALSAPLDVPFPCGTCELPLPASAAVSAPLDVPFPCGTCVVRSPAHT